MKIHYIRTLMSFQAHMLLFSSIFEKIFTVIDRLFKVTMSVKLQKEGKKAPKKAPHQIMTWSQSFESHVIDVRNRNLLVIIR